MTYHADPAYAKSVLGVNGALDFGPLAGDQPGHPREGARLEQVRSTRRDAFRGVPIKEAEFPKEVLRKTVESK